MASILRSGKFFRFFTNVTRNIGLNNANHRESDTLLCSRRNEWDIKLHRSLATIQIAQLNLGDGQAVSGISATSKVDRSIYRADIDITKTGRVARKDIENIIEEIKEMKTATPTQSLLLIRCCGNSIPEELPEARTDLVHSIWATLENLGATLDISHYNSLLRVYIENEHTFSPHEFLDQLADKKIEPNKLTYQRLIAAFCLRGDLDGASTILETMKAKNLPINESVFNALLMGHSRLGDHESAKGIINIMRQSGINPDSETYKLLATGYVKSGTLEDIEATIKECQEKGVTLRDRDLFDVLYAAAIHNRPDIFDGLLAKLRKESGYNSDCVNNVLRIVNVGQYEMAFKILLSMKSLMTSEGKPMASGIYFIKQLVKSPAATSDVIAYCDRLAELGLNERAVNRAFEAAVELGRQDRCEMILKHIAAKQPIGPRFFWPLLKSSNEKGEESLLAVLKQMTSVRCTPNIETVHTHVLPHLADASISNIARKLRSASVPANIVGASLLLQSLQRNDLPAACQTAALYRVYLDGVLLRVAADAYLNTKDAPAFAKFMSLLEVRRDSRGVVVAAEAPAPGDGSLKPLLTEILSRARAPKELVIEPLLTAMCARGLSISNGVALMIQEGLGESMNESMAGLLAKLISGELQPVSDQEGVFHDDQDKLRDLLTKRDLDAALALKTELESQNLKIRDYLKAWLMSICAESDRTDEAWTIYCQITSSSTGSKFTFGPEQLFELAAALLKSDRLDDVPRVLDGLVSGRKVHPRGPMAAWRLLSIAADKGDVALTQDIFERIEKLGMMEPKRLLGSLVRVHLVRNDSDAAYKVVEHCFEAYKCLPLKSALMKRLIETEDAQLLQKLMDLSSKASGEMNSLYDLVIAFIDCGRVRQAKKILETPGIRARHERLRTACEHYIEEGRIDELDNLVKVTKDLFGIDRNLMYDYLLTGRLKTGNADQALAVWTQMLEEDVQPSNDFLHRLGTFLIKNDRLPPFTVPSAPAVAPAKESKQASKVAPVATKVEDPAKVKQEPKVRKVGQEVTEVGRMNEELLRALREEDVDRALEIKKKIEEVGTLSFKNKSKLIESLIKKDRLDLAADFVMEMLHSKTHPNESVFRFYCKTLVSNADVARIEAMAPYLTEQLAEMIRYNTVLYSAASKDVAKATNLLDALKTKADEASLLSDDDRVAKMSELKRSFSRGGFQAMLENPELLDQCEQVSEAYLKLGITYGANCLWCHYLINGKEQEAAQQWSKFSSHSGSVAFLPITRSIRDSNNTHLAANLLDTLSTSQFITKSALGNAYSAWIDALIGKGEAAEAEKLVTKALDKGVQLEEINRRTLIRLKDTLAAANIVFLHTIPEKRTNSKAQSSLSSDSDTEKQ